MTTSGTTWWCPGTQATCTRSRLTPALSRSTPMAPETSISKVGPGASGEGLAPAQTPPQPSKVTLAGMAFQGRESPSPAHGPLTLSTHLCVQPALFLAQLRCAWLSREAALSTLTVWACPSSAEPDGHTLKLGVGSLGFQRPPGPPGLSSLPWLGDGDRTVSWQMPPGGWEGAVKREKGGAIAGCPHIPSALAGLALRTFLD